MTLRVLIVDDESLARQRVRRFVKADRGLDLIGECADGREAIRSIRQNHPDLVFLDVQMPELDGFEVIRYIGVEAMPPVIFVTAHDEHALAAFEAQAIDYLLKPFSETRFAQSLQRARRYLQSPEQSIWQRRLIDLLAQVGVKSESSERVAIKVDGRLLLLRIEEIDWVEAMGDYVKLHVGRETHTVRGRMTFWEKRLPANRFRRTHRSCIVNLDRVRECVPTFGGDYIVVLKSGERLKANRQVMRSLHERLEGGTA
jgi:two-component system LytT family response regulator